MKRLTIGSFFAFGIQLLQAGTMGPVCNSQNVTVACPDNYWDLGITALYFKPGTASYLLNPYLTVPVGRTFHNVKSPWDWSFIVEGSYHFNTGNDLNLNWLHFSVDNSDRFTRFFPASEATGPDNLRTTSLQMDTSLDAVNLEFAQTARFALDTTIRFHGGMHYANAKVNRYVQEFEQVEDPPEFNFQTTSVSTNFEGIGPRVGVDMSHNLNYGFKVFAQGAMAILSGKEKAKLSGSNRSGPIDVFFGARATLKSMVPELDARLGASYDWNTNGGQVSLTAGWLFQHYFNMLLLPPGEALNNSTTVTAHNFFLNGPYIKGKWVSKA